MNCTVSYRPGGWVAVFIMLSTSLYAQPVKENRNNYPKPLPETQKLELSVQRAKPFIFSPHLSYKEQKQIQLAKKKVGGITFVVRSSKSVFGKSSSNNYKRPVPGVHSRSSASEQLIADTTAPFVRYELTDSVKSANR